MQSRWSGRADRGDDARQQAAAVQRLLQERFAAQCIDVEPAGNVLAATAFLHGIAAEELQSDELAVRDDDYTVCIMARATRT